uniref:AAA+-type ATPase, cell division protein FTSH n=1 Tax=Leontynka pallida TaxID=2912034 RepID=UPI002027C4DF|nr:AAA+-type ATPase, cell division protein FTSH [Leontynka pallida]UPQ43866.1 AAA+-type ATPase, cell division protein FTSH [Leontynka pallida]
MSSSHKQFMNGLAYLSNTCKRNTLCYTGPSVAQKLGISCQQDTLVCKANLNDNPSKDKSAKLTSNFNQTLAQHKLVNTALPYKKNISSNKNKLIYLGTKLLNTNQVANTEMLYELPSAPLKLLGVSKDKSTELTCLVNNRKDKLNSSFKNFLKVKNFWFYKKAITKKANTSPQGVNKCFKTFDIAAITPNKKAVLTKGNNKKNSFSLYLKDTFINQKAFILGASYKSNLIASKDKSAKLTLAKANVKKGIIPTSTMLWDTTNTYKHFYYYWLIPLMGIVSFNAYTANKFFINNPILNSTTSIVTSKDKSAELTSIDKSAELTSHSAQKQTALKNSKQHPSSLFKGSNLLPNYSSKNHYVFDAISKQGFLTSSTQTQAKKQLERTYSLLYKNFYNTATHHSFNPIPSSYNTTALIPKTNSYNLFYFFNTNLPLKIQPLVNWEKLHTTKDKSAELTSRLLKWSVTKVIKDKSAELTSRPLKWSVTKSYKDKSAELTSRPLKWSVTKSYKDKSAELTSRPLKWSVTKSYKDKSAELTSRRLKSSVTKVIKDKSAKLTSSTLVKGNATQSLPVIQTNSSKNKSAKLTLLANNLAHHSLVRSTSIAGTVYKQDINLTPVFIVKEQQQTKSNAIAKANKPGSNYNLLLEQVVKYLANNDLKNLTNQTATLPKLSNLYASVAKQPRNLVASNPINLVTLPTHSQPFASNSSKWRIATQAETKLKGWQNILTPVFKVNSLLNKGENAVKQTKILKFFVPVLIKRSNNPASYPYNNSINNKSSLLEPNFTLASATKAALGSKSEEVSFAGLSEVTGYASSPEVSFAGLSEVTGYASSPEVSFAGLSSVTGYASSPEVSFAGLSSVTGYASSLEVSLAGLSLVTKQHWHKPNIAPLNSTLKSTEHTNTFLLNNSSILTTKDKSAELTSTLQSLFKKNLYLFVDLLLYNTQNIVGLKDLFVFKDGLPYTPSFCKYNIATLGNKNKGIAALHTTPKDKSAELTSRPLKWSVTKVIKDKSAELTSRPLKWSVTKSYKDKSAEQTSRPLKWSVTKSYKDKSAELTSFNPFKVSQLVLSQINKLNANTYLKPNNSYAIDSNSQVSHSDTGRKIENKTAALQLKAQSPLNSVNKQEVSFTGLSLEQLFRHYIGIMSPTKAKSFTAHQKNSQDTSKEKSAELTSRPLKWSVTKVIKDKSAELTSFFVFTRKLASSILNKRYINSIAATSSAKRKVLKAPVHFMQKDSNLAQTSKDKPAKLTYTKATLNQNQQTQVSLCDTGKSKVLFRTNSTNVLLRNYFMLFNTTSPVTIPTKDKSAELISKTETDRKLAQKKRRKKKLKKETRCRKKRKRFYPRPISTTFKLYHSFLNKITQTPNQSFGQGRIATLGIRTLATDYQATKSSQQRKSFNSKEVSPAGLSLVVRVTPFNNYNLNLKASILNTIYWDSFNFNTPNAISNEFKRLSWKSAWMRSNYNSYLNRINSYLKSLKAKTTKWELYLTLQSIYSTLSGNYQVLPINHWEVSSADLSLITLVTDHFSGLEVSSAGLSLEVVTDHFSGLEVVTDHFSGLEVVTDHFSGLEVVTDHFSGLEVVTDHFSGLEVVTDHFSGLEVAYNTSEYNRLLYQRITNIIYNIKENITINGQNRIHAYKNGHNWSTQLQNNKLNDLNFNALAYTQNIFIKLSSLFLTKDSNQVKNNAANTLANHTNLFSIQYAPLFTENPRKNISKLRLYWGINKTFINKKIKVLGATNEVRFMNANNTVDTWSKQKKNEQSQTNKTKKLLLTCTKTLDNLLNLFNIHTVNTRVLNGVKAYSKDKSAELTSSNIQLLNINTELLNKIKNKEQKLSYFGFSLIEPYNYLLSESQLNRLIFSSKNITKTVALKKAKYNQSINSLNSPKFLNGFNVSSYWWTVQSVDVSFADLSLDALFNSNKAAQGPYNKIFLHSNQTLSQTTAFLLINFSFFLFHFCAVISLIKFSQVRSVIKTGIVLLNKSGHLVNILLNSNVYKAKQQLEQSIWYNPLNRPSLTQKQASILTKATKRDYTPTKDKPSELSNSLYLQGWLVFKQLLFYTYKYSLLMGIAKEVRSADLSLDSKTNKEIITDYFSSLEVSSAGLSLEVITSNSFSYYMEVNFAGLSNVLNEAEALNVTLYYKGLLKHTMLGFYQKLYKGSSFSYSFVYKTISWASYIFSSIVSSVFVFFEKPGELFGDWIAFAFLVEWSSDLSNTINEKIDYSLYTTFSKTIRPLHFIPLIHNRFLKFFDIAFAELSQPDTDLLNRQNRGSIFWDVWADFLIEISDKSNINIATLSTNKEEQNALLRSVIHSAIFKDTKQYNTSINNRLVSKDRVKPVKWSVNQFLTSTGSNNNNTSSLQNLFIDINLPKSLKSCAQIKNSSIFYNNKVGSQAIWGFLPNKNEQPIGSLVCQIFSGIFYKQVSKNLLIIGKSNTVTGSNESAFNTVGKSLIVQAIAGETELRIITDNANRYSMVHQGVAVGIKLLRDVFDAIALHTPCLFLIEDIHVIGERRPLLIADGTTSDNTASGSEREGYPGGLDTSIHEKNQVLYQLSKHTITHYKKPFKGDFSLSIPSNIFSFDLFTASNSKGSIQKVTESNATIAKNLQIGSQQNWLFLNGQVRSNNNPIYNILNYNRIQQSPIKIKDSSSANNSPFQEVSNADLSLDQIKYTKDKLATLTSKLPTNLAIKPNPLLSPPATSPFSVLILKEQNKKISPTTTVDELPFNYKGEGLGAEKLAASYSIRVKIALLADLAMSNLSVKLDMITDLLVIIDSVRGNRGFVVFATTHLPFILDPALRRPGRLDETLTLSLTPTLFNKWELLKSKVGVFNSFKSDSIYPKGLSFILYNGITAQDSAQSNQYINNLIFNKSLRINKQAIINSYGHQSFANAIVSNKRSQHNWLILRKANQVSSADLSLVTQNPNLIIKARFLKNILKPYKANANIDSLQKPYKANASIESLQKPSKDKPAVLTYIQTTVLKGKATIQYLKNKLNNSAESFSSSFINQLLADKTALDLTPTIVPDTEEFINQTSNQNDPNKSEVFISLYSSTNVLKQYILKLLIGYIFSNGMLSKCHTAAQTKAKNNNIKDLNSIKWWSNGLVTSLISSFIQKRYIYQKNLIIPQLLSLGTNTMHGKVTTGGIDYKELPSPPASNILLPAKKYENSKRLNHFNFITSKEVYSIYDKIQNKNEQLLLGELANQNREWYVNTITDKHKNNLTLFKKLISQNTYKTNFVNLPTSSYWYYRNRIYNRHKNYLYNLWSNAQLPEHSIEATILSDIDWRSKAFKYNSKTTKESVTSKLLSVNTQQLLQNLLTTKQLSHKHANKTNTRKLVDIDCIIDFPDADQYYNLQNRRWFLTYGTWNTWFDFNQGDCVRNSFIAESLAKAYNLIEQNREVLDYLTITGINNKSTLSQKELYKFFYTISRFK